MKTILHTLFFFLMVTQICFAQWYQQNSGTTANLNAVTFTDANNGFAVGDSGAILHTSNGGMQWIEQQSGTELALFDVYFSDFNNGWIFGGNSDGYFSGDTSLVLHTIDGGINWIAQQIGSDCSTIYDCNFTDSFYGAFSATTTIGTTFHRTTDGGIHWQEYVFQSPGGFDLRSSVHFCDSNDGWLIEVSGSQFFGSNIQRTSDGGLSWYLATVIDASILKRIYFFNTNFGIAVGDYSGPRKSSVDGKIAITTNGGVNWDVQDSGFVSLQNVFLKNSTTGIVVGDSGKIYSTNDLGTTWLEQMSGTNNSLNGIYFIDDLNGWIVGGGGTILHTTNGGVSFVEEEQINEIPIEFLLSQNYPNPFNPSTKIKYSIPPVGTQHAVSVQIKVYDVLGNEIETLVNEEKPAGTFEITWYAEQLPSGVYFYQLSAGSFIETKKMILLK